MIEAAEELVIQRPDCGFILFGDGPLRAKLEREIAERGLEDLFVLPGFRSDLSKYLPNLDLAVMPSFTEGLPVVLLETGAAGVPTVATAVGGIPEVIDDGKSGFLAPSGDARKLAEPHRHAGGRRITAAGDGPGSPRAGAARLLLCKHEPPVSRAIRTVDKEAASPGISEAFPGVRVQEGPMITAVKRLRLEFEDWLRYHPTVRGSLCRMSLLRGRQPDPADTQAVARHIVHLCSVLRLAENPTLEQRINAQIVEQVRHLEPSRIDWSEFVADFHEPRVNKSIILKPCLGPREKGVLFVAFEEKWIKLLKPANYRELAERYTVVLSPSCSPPHVLSTYAFPAIFPGPVFTLISNRKDLDYFPRMSPNLIPVPLYASSWVNPDLFQPLPRKKREYDLLMVANFAKVKRHLGVVASSCGQCRATSEFC